jgi:hypothetical protein
MIDAAMPLGGESTHDANSEEIVRGRESCSRRGERAEGDKAVDVWEALFRAGKQ